MQKHFADFWERVTDKKAAKKRGQLISQFIKKYHPHARSVLELGTGHGLVLTGIPNKYELFGLDIEPRYAALTKKNVARAKVQVASMHNFKMKRPIDVIFSVYDSVDYLESAKKWKQMLECVHKNLKANGLFIFDTYTPKMLKKHKNSRAFFDVESFGFSADQGVVKGNTLTWDIKIFEKQQDSHYALNQFYFKEYIFEPKVVERLVKKRFRILKKMDESLKSPKKSSTKLIYVCRKK